MTAGNLVARFFSLSSPKPVVAYRRPDKRDILRFAAISLRDEGNNRVSLNQIAQCVRDDLGDDETARLPEAALASLVATHPSYKLDASGRYELID
jgi:hypothetical protein